MRGEKGNRESYRYARNKNEGKCSGKRVLVVFSSHHYREAIFSHFLHSYQLLLDEIVTVEPSTELFLCFFSHFVWEGWEMIVNYLSYGCYMVFGSCLAFGPKNWVQKKDLIQETICSVSKCLNPLFELFLCYLSFYGKGYFTQK